MTSNSNGNLIFISLESRDEGIKFKQFLWKLIPGSWCGKSGEKDRKGKRQQMRNYCPHQIRQIFCYGQIPAKSNLKMENYFAPDYICFSPWSAGSIAFNL